MPRAPPAAGRSFGGTGVNPDFGGCDELRRHEIPRYSPAPRCTALLRSRFLRPLGFTLSLLAAAISSLAGEAVIIRCEEPDGCVEIELVSRATPKGAACSDHGHEAAPAVADEPLSHESCLCVDTVIASISGAVLRDEGGRESLVDRVAVLAIQLTPLQVVAVHRRDLSMLPASPAVDQRGHYSRRSVVLRI